MAYKTQRQLAILMSGFISCYSPQPSSPGREAHCSLLNIPVIPLKRWCPSCSHCPEYSSPDILMAHFLISFRNLLKSFLSETSPAECLKLSWWHSLLPLLALFFLPDTCHHMIFCYLFIVYFPLLECGTGILCVCSLLYPQDLTQVLAHNKCLINICWISELTLM